MKKLSDVKFDIDQKVFILCTNKVKKVKVIGIKREDDRILYTLENGELKLTTRQQEDVFSCTEDLIKSITEGL